MAKKRTAAQTDLGQELAACIAKLAELEQRIATAEVHILRLLHGTPFENQPVETPHADSKS